MEVTGVKFHVNNNKESKVLASASVCFDDQFVIHRILLINGDKGRFIQFPQTTLKNDEKKDVCHPINTETRAKIQKDILNLWDGFTEVYGLNGEEQKDECAETDNNETSEETNN